MADPPVAVAEPPVAAIPSPAVTPESIALPDSDVESIAATDRERDEDVDAGVDSVTSAAPAPRRSSIEKRPIVMEDDDQDEEDDIDEVGERVTKNAFERLPDEIIQQILQLTDPNSFASLVLLNSKWRSVSQQAELYAFQLSQCPSYSASHTKPPVAKDDNLPELRQLFAQEVKRNLFAAYLRPNKTVIKVISNSISSSSCPGGEGLQFSPSPRGHHLLAYNSSRIHIIDVRGAEIAVTRELKILRRPAATAIKDDGSLLAVLLTEMQVDLYDLEASPPKRTQSIILDHSPRAIALSPDGSVLAAAYEGGIEVTSLNPGALPTERRAVKCDGVDALAFSFDGTQILGTTVQSGQPNTVILTAPYYDPGSHNPDDTISALWTTSILFPNSSRDCSHAVLLQNTSREEASWTFTYDSSFETFRAVSIDDLRNGTTYFTGPIPKRRDAARLMPCTLPAATYTGDLVSAGFQGSDIWIYGVPEDLDAPVNLGLTAAEAGSGGNLNGLHRRNSGTPQRSNSSRTHDPPSNDDIVPQWQILCDKLRNTFVSGTKVAELSGVSTVRWVEGFGKTSLNERLIVAARGIMPPRPITEDEGFDFVDGGRVILVDFDYGINDGQVVEVEIEVGTKEPEVLEEEHRDLATEVAIVRRRTVAQRMGSRGNIMRSATTAANAPPMPPLPAMPPLPQPSPEEDDDDDPLVPRRRAPGPNGRLEVPAEPIEEDEDAEPTIEEQEALDQPYAHASPRSAPTLRRAATAAAINRRLQGPQPAAGRHNIQYRRADGRAEHPHESDADNWVPPPPPYQKEDPQDLPAFMRHKVAPTSTGDSDTGSGLSQPQLLHPGQATAVQPQPPRSQTTAPAAFSPVRQSMMPRTVTQPPLSHHRFSSGPSALLDRPRSSGTLMSNMTGRGSLRPSSSPNPSMMDEGAGLDNDDDLYDVSPPASPGPQAASTTSAGPGPSTSSNVMLSKPLPAAPSASAVSTPSLDSASLAVSRPNDSPASRLQPNKIVNREPSPRLSLAIPSPTLMSSATFSHPDASSAVAGPSSRRLSQSQTWPRQMPPPQPAAAIAPSGYPYSAPVAPAPNGLIPGAYPPQPPMPVQHYSAGPQQQVPGFMPTPTSAATPTGFGIPRVPVGSRDSWRYSSQANHQLPSPSRHPLQQHPPPIAHPQPQRILPPPVEDQPLIISTPKGVTGAFDDPSMPGAQTQIRTETPIIAPVPRHPRVNERASVLQPPAPDVITQPNPMMQPNPHPQQHMQQFPPQQQHPGFNPTGAPLGFLAAPHQPATQRNPSLTRRQSRAERSAAKNIADAKKKGWRRSKSTRRSKRQSQMPGGDPAAWTDVAGSEAAGYTEQGGGGGGKKAKCAVM